ncbi:Uncharacterised protein [Mycobacteroides abscessus subsp. abscessus]|nr:Uncharacterised protein [Mycobacteroides abscessus subsp. abscessus]
MRPRRPRGFADREHRSRLAGNVWRTRRALQAAAGTDPGSTLSEMEIDTNYDGAVIWQVALVHRDGSTLQIDVDAKSAAISAR